MEMTAMMLRGCRSKTDAPLTLECIKKYVVVTSGLWVSIVDKSLRESMTARCRETHRQPQNVVVSPLWNLYIVVQDTKTTKHGLPFRMMHGVASFCPLICAAFAALTVQVGKQKNMRGWATHAKGATAVIAGRPCHDFLA
jgi:hypothetical protein